LEELEADMLFTKRGLTLVSGIMILAAQAAPQESAARSYSTTVQEHLDAATFLAGNDMPRTLLPNLLSAMPNSGLPRNTNKAVAPPTKVFDQLYFFGMGSVGSWALVTSAGIIQFDTLDNPDEAERIIVAGYREAGLNPADMKYIVVTHSHFDHVGGARYLQDKYHPRVMLSEADWDMMARPPVQGKAAPPAPPTRDMVVTDGQKLTLGNTTVTLYLTPGHTPGTISAIIPVTENGQPHVLSFWGGTGFPSTFEPTATSGGLIKYEQSLQRFTAIGEAAKADGVISNHSEIDGSFENVFKIRNRKPGDPNPFIIGQGAYRRFMGILFEFMEASKDLVREKVR
jgi:metallo-beta-lactamase class B